MGTGTPQLVCEDRQNILEFPSSQVLVARRPTVAEEAADVSMALLEDEGVPGPLECHQSAHDRLEGGEVGLVPVAHGPTSDGGRPALLAGLGPGIAAVAVSFISHVSSPLDERERMDGGGWDGRSCNHVAQPPLWFLTVISTDPHR